MTIQEVIQRAIEGGLNYADPEIIKLESRGALHRILLMPSFWQALGKAMGWGSSNMCPSCNQVDDIPKLDWFREWHRLIDALSEGKSIESFFSLIDLPKEQ